MAFGEVVQKIQLTPTMVRVILGGEGLDDYEPKPCTDEYIAGLFLPEGSPLRVPFTADEAQAVAPEYRPRNRHYTVRWWNPENRTMAVDFVAHGDEGHAGVWAVNAQLGDQLQFLGPGGAYSPDPEAAWYLMVGDESAIPAIARSLEHVRTAAPVQVVLVVDGATDEMEFESPGDLQITWLHRNYADDDTQQVVDAVAAIEFPEGRPDVFVHGEAAEIRAVRRHLLSDRGLIREGTSISPYWRRGETDEVWRQHKREWVAEMNAEV